MRYLLPIALAAALVAGPLAAQPAKTPPASTSDSTPAVEQASYCAALQTVLGVLLGQSSNPNPALQEKLKRSTVRWLNHANADVDQSTPKGRVLVLDRYSAHSDALFQERVMGKMEAAAVREAMNKDLAICEQAERDTFGNSYKDL
jgi:hypothetical protein